SLTTWRSSIGLGTGARCYHSRYDVAVCVCHLERLRQSLGRASSDAPRLGRDEVHVWSARLDPPPAELVELTAALTQAERARPDRGVTERLRTRALASRGLLRALLGRYLGCTPGAVELVDGPRGKPRLA